MSFVELSRGTEAEHKMPSFGKIIIGTTFAKNRAIGSDVKKICIGDLLGEFAWLRRRLDQRPESNYTYKHLLVVNQSFPKMEPHELIGDKNWLYDGEDGSLIIKRLDPENGQGSEFKEELRDKFVGAVISTNRLEKPPSFGEIESLLLEENDFSSATCFLQTGNKENIFVFRGTKTPLLSQDKVLQEKMKWKQESALSCSGNYFKSLLSNQKQDNNNIFNKIVDAYNFVVFRGDVRSQIVDRVTV